MKKVIFWTIIYFILFLIVKFSFKEIISEESFVIVSFVNCLIIQTILTFVVLRFLINTIKDHISFIGFGDKRIVGFLIFIIIILIVIIFIPVFVIQQYYAHISFSDINQTKKAICYTGLISGFVTANSLLYFLFNKQKS